MPTLARIATTVLSFEVKRQGAAPDVPTEEEGCSRMSQMAVVTKDAITGDEFATLIASHWNDLRAAPPEETTDAAKALLALRSGDVIEIKNVAPDTMGFGLTAGAAFAIAFKFVAAHAPAVAAKFGEALVVAAARELVLEILKRLRAKRGAEFAKEASPKVSPGTQA